MHVHVHVGDSPTQLPWLYCVVKWLSDTDYWSQQKKHFFFQVARVKYYLANVKEKNTCIEHEWMSPDFNIVRFVCLNNSFGHMISMKKYTIIPWNISVWGAVTFPHWNFNLQETEKRINLNSLNLLFFHWGHNIKKWNFSLFLNTVHLGS